MPRKKSQKPKTKKQHKKPGWIGWAIIFLSVFIAVFAVSMLMTPSQVTVVQYQPGIIRIQILNGCGANGAVEAVSQALTGDSVGVFFDIIDKANAQAYTFEKTLVVDRRGGAEIGFSQPASTVAQLLNINQDNLLIQRLADNLLDIDVTVIVGADYLSVIENMKRGKKAVDS